jgi:ABC-type branched-subunit amino acid transport system ATPase component
MEKILSLENISKSFASGYTSLSGGQEIELSEILNDISFDLKKGTAMAIIGTNGSGKSTLFNIISGLLKPNTGQITYMYQHQLYNLTKIPEYSHARIGIARLFQGSNIFPNLTVLENMLVADNNRYGEQPWHIFRNTTDTENSRKDEAEKILTDLLGADNPLWVNRNEFAGNLSIGQQRLLAFARLFMNEWAELYLLDEPCAGVNPDIRKLMARMIHNLWHNNKTVLLIEHNLDFVQETCTEAIYLEAGRVAYKGSVKETLSQKSLTVNYLGSRKTE